MSRFALAVGLLVIIAQSSARLAPHGGSAATALRVGGGGSDAALGLEPLPLSGQVALVTGGGRGIGAAISLKLAERGARVVITYREDGAAAEATMASLPGSGHAAHRCDVCDADAVEALVAKVGDDLGGLDIVVNNAGVYVDHPILETSYADWRRTFALTTSVNLIGPANVMYCAAHHMAARGVEGKIINVSSRGAVRGEPKTPAYGASKAGLNSMSQSLAQQLAPSGIVVGVVAPGFVETDMARAVLDGPDGDGIRSQSGFRRVATVDEVAEAVVFFTTPGATWCTGAVLDCNGASYLH